MIWQSALLVVLAVLSSGGLHKIHEGFVGVYFRGGALLTSVTGPGWHWKLPLVTEHKTVQVTMQTDLVRDIPCGTQGGVVLYFDSIEVVNRLKPEFVYQTIKNYTTSYDKSMIFDKVHHAINEFCSVHTLEEVYISKFGNLDESLLKSLQESCDLWAPGIELVAIRVTKPRIPSSIRQSYEDMEAEKTQYLIASQRQKVVVKEAETDRARKILEAKQELDIARIEAKKMIAEKLAEKGIAVIQAQVHLDHQKSLANAETYKIRAEAETNKQLLSPEFLALDAQTSALENAHFYIGDKIPSSLGVPLSNLK